MVSDTTKLIAHIGYPTEFFRAPKIYDPYFNKQGIGFTCVIVEFLNIDVG